MPRLDAPSAHSDRKPLHASQPTLGTVDRTPGGRGRRRQFLGFETRARELAAPTPASERERVRVCGRRTRLRGAREQRVARGAVAAAGAAVASHRILRTRNSPVRSRTDYQPPRRQDPEQSLSRGIASLRQRSESESDGTCGGVRAAQRR